MVELSLTKILQNINLLLRSDNANTSGNTNHKNVSTQQQPHIQLNDQGNCNLSGNNLNPNTKFLPMFRLLVTQVICIQIQ